MRYNRPFLNKIIKQNESKQKVEKDIVLFFFATTFLYFIDFCHFEISGVCFPAPKHHHTKTHHTSKLESPHFFEPLQHSCIPPHPVLFCLSTSNTRFRRETRTKSVKRFHWLNKSFLKYKWKFWISTLLPIKQV